MSSDEIYEKGKGKRKLTPNEKRALIKRIENKLEPIKGIERIKIMGGGRTQKPAHDGPIHIPMPSKRTTMQRMKALSMDAEVADMLMRIAQRRDKAMYRFRRGIPYGLTALGGATVGAILEYIRENRNKKKD